MMLLGEAEVTVAGGMENMSLAPYLVPNARTGEAVVADLGASRALGHGLELFFAAENLGNARVETGRSADGVVNTGTPRLISGGVRGAW